jgi:hypothetical protein
MFHGRYTVMESRFIFFLLFFITTSSSAEYRAFLLKISGPRPSETTNLASAPVKTATSTKEPSSTLPDFRLVKSNLSAEQYGTYYPLKAGETIADVDTWMCRERTSDFLEICENPKDLLRAPASTTAPAAESPLAPPGPVVPVVPPVPKP